MKFVTDGLRSLIGKLGDPTRDKGAGLSFAAPLIGDDQLAAAYEGNWVARKVVDVPAKDALREWRVWHGDDRDAIAAEETRLRLRQKTLDAQIKARTFGGAAILIGTGQEPSEPLDVDAVGQGGLRYATVLTRRELTAGDIELDPLAENYGKPREYEIASGTGRQVKIHPSHLAFFRGDARADRHTLGMSDQGWDQSVLVTVAQAIKEFSGSTQNVASLIFEANVDVIGIPDLAAQLSKPGGEEAVMKRLSLATANKGINGSLVMDALETYQRKGATFADLTSLLESFALFVAAGADIPATRFLARSPTGLNATGGLDQQNYFDKIRAMQTLDIGPGMERLDQCLVRSAGADIESRYDWAPLERENPKELAELGKATAETLEILLGLGYSDAELKELTTHRMSELGVFPHIEEIVKEAIARTELDPLPDDDGPDGDEPEDEAA